MSKTNTAETPLETVTEAAGPNATEAFSILGNETRLAILITLWDELDPFAEDPTDYMVGAAIPFSELRRRVGVRDPGQFHYHIDQLVGRLKLSRRSRWYSETEDTQYPAADSE